MNAADVLGNGIACTGMCTNGAAVGVSVVKVTVVIGAVVVTGVNAPLKFWEFVVICGATVVVAGSMRSLTHLTVREAVSTFSRSKLEASSAMRALSNLSALSISNCRLAASAAAAAAAAAARILLFFCAS